MGYRCAERETVRGRRKEEEEEAGGRGRAAARERGGADRRGPGGREGRVGTRVSREGGPSRAEWAEGKAIQPERIFED